MPRTSPFPIRLPSAEAAELYKGRGALSVFSPSIVPADVGDVEV